MTISRRPRRRRSSCPRLLAGSGLALLLVGACAPEEIEPQRLSTASLVPDLGFYKGFYLPLDNEVLYETDDVKVTANGNLALTFAEANFAATAVEKEEEDDPNELETYQAQMNLKGALTVELSVEGGGAIEGELEVISVPLGAFGIGPNVEVIPYATVRLLANGTADADARLSIVAPFRFGSRVSSPGSNGTLGSDSRFEPELGPPELIGNFTGEVAVDVTMAFMTTVFGFPVGGPFIGTRWGAVLEIDTNTSTWDLDATGELNGGWASPDELGGPDLPEPPPLERDLGQWNVDEGAIPDFSTSWSWLFDIENGDRATAALRSGDDGLIVTESGTRHWLAELDGDGVPEWQGASAEGLETRAMAYSSTGDLLVVGERGGTSIVVERITPSVPVPLTVWRNVMTVPGANFAKWNAILPTSTGGAILAGDVSYSGFQRAILAAVDSAGVLQWQTEVDAGAGSTNPIVKALAFTSSGQILAVGDVTFTPPNGTSGSYGLVLRLDTDGTLQTALAIGDGSQHASLVTAFPDGTYTIAGTDAVPLAVWIASVKANDTLAWSAGYQSRPDNDNAELAAPTGLAALGSRALLVSGFIGTVPSNGWLLRIDRTGMPMWVKSYITDGMDNELLGVMAMPGGLAAFGSAGQSTAMDLWVLRTKPDGMAHFIDGNGFETENTAMQWQRNSGHAVHVLAPSPVPTTLTGTPSGFTFNPAAALSQFLTD